MTRDDSAGAGGGTKQKAAHGVQTATDADKPFFTGNACNGNSPAGQEMMPIVLCQRLGEGALAISQQVGVKVTCDRRQYLGLIQ